MIDVVTRPKKSGLEASTSRPAYSLPREGYLEGVKWLPLLPRSSIPIVSNRNHVHDRPYANAASVILIPGILFTRLSHSRPLCTRLLVGFGAQTKTRDHLLSYPLELRRGTSAPSGSSVPGWTSSSIHERGDLDVEWPNRIKTKAAYAMLDVMLIPTLENHHPPDRWHDFYPTLLAVFFDLRSTFMVTRSGRALGARWTPAAFSPLSLMR